MSPQMNGEPRDRPLSNLDSASTPISPALDMHEADRPLLREIKEDGHLAPLFAQGVAMDFRSRWDAVQRGFVDDPQAAVRAGDDLVTQVIKSLAETFASQRSELDGHREHAEESTTESLRVSLRRYRSFFERLLSI